MKNFKKIGCTLFTAGLLLSFCWGAAAAYADTTIITTTHEPYFHTGSNPIAGIFYFLGDVVILPFRLVGDLFA